MPRKSLILFAALLQVASPALLACPLGGYNPPIPPYVEPAGNLRTSPGRADGPNQPEPGTTPASEPGGEATPSSDPAGGTTPSPEPSEPAASPDPLPPPAPRGGTTTPLPGFSPSTAPSPFPGGAGPRTGGSTPRVGRKRSSQGPGLERWEYWWAINKDSYLWRQRERKRATQGNSDYALGRSGSGVVEDSAPSSTASAPSPLRAILPVCDEALRDSCCKTRSAALLSLGRARDVGSLSRLMKSLKDRCSHVQGTAVFGLGLLGDPLVIPLLNDIVQRGAFAKRMLGTNSIDGKTRAYAAAALGLIEGDEGVPTLIGALADRELEVAQAAAVSLGALRKSAALEPLSRIVQSRSQDRRLRIHALTALGRIGSPEVLPLVRAFLESKDADLKRSAILAAGLLATPEDRDVVKELRRFAERGRDPLAANWSLMALGRIGGSSARKTLLTVLTEDRNSSKGVFSAIALGVKAFESGERIDRDLQFVREAFLGAKNKSVKAGFAIALGLLDDRASIEVLGAELAENGGPEYEGYLTVALGMLDAERAEPVFRAALREKGKPHLSACTAQALGLLGDRETLGYIQETLSKHPRALDPLAMTMALGCLGEEEGVKTLCGLADKKQSSEKSRLLALKALGSLADRVGSEGAPAYYRFRSQCNYGAQFRTLREVMLIL